jgi:hypothetical protein
MCIANVLQNLLMHAAECNRTDILLQLNPSPRALPIFQGVRLRIPAEADQHSWLIPITIPA